VLLLRDKQAICYYSEVKIAIVKICINRLSGFLHLPNIGEEMGEQ
jgi:hypothetical protein